MRKNDSHCKSDQVGPSQNLIILWNGKNLLAGDWNRTTVITILVSDVATAYCLEMIFSKDIEQMLTVAIVMALRE